MSFGEGYGGYGERDRTDDESPAGLTTTTRLPDGEGGGRTPPRPGRSVVTLVGVVVLLIAAIAFANQGGDDGDSADGRSPGEAQPTAPTGREPVESDGDIPSGFPQSKQGAESAAANYAVALGGDGMFDKDSRHKIVQAVGAPSSVPKLQQTFDEDYSSTLNKSIGLDKNGKAPSGSTFVNRTMPVGTHIRSFDSHKAAVDVWCSGLVGVAGEKSTKPVKTSWFTVTYNLRWSDGDWKVAGSKQKDGPTPVNSDSPISKAEEISKAVEEFGGFTYAR